MSMIQFKSIEEEYRERFASSAGMYEAAKKVFPSGVTHDNRFSQPFPLYIAREEGSRKWDLDGHELIDYWMGHGALLLGHGAPAVIAAVQKQLTSATHIGGSHVLEITWGEIIQRLVPSAELVKFVSSGTEATMMAIRLARAYTGRTKLLKFEGHFHGWHDYATAGLRPPFDVPSSVGIPRETLSTVVAVPPNDLHAVEAAIGPGDVACVMLEPAGGSNGAIPTKPGFLAGLRDLTARTGVVLIFDEVISGFRYAPGGAQQRYGVTPDMSTLAKIVAGGLPGGAVVGKREIMELLAFRDDAHWNRFQRIAHPGTFNANPLSAAAGIATLQIIAQGQATEQANQMGEALRQGLRETILRLGVPGWVYGEASVFKVILGEGSPHVEADRPETYADYGRLLAGLGSLSSRFRAALVLEGVDLMGNSGMTSAAHTPADVRETVEAFERALKRLKKEQLI